MLFDSIGGSFDTSESVTIRTDSLCPRPTFLLFKYKEFSSDSLTVFDNAPRRKPTRPSVPATAPEDPEDARIALRCNRKELRLVDAFVANGEFATRSELMRAALRAFLEARALSTAPTPAVDAEGLVEVSVRLRPEEYSVVETYARYVVNGRPVRDVLAEIVRHGELEMKVDELVKRARETVREAVESRTRFGALEESGKDLERKGVVGR
jgi:Arc/MetJ-type ribon-helix-helix transcriptional regulator